MGIHTEAGHTINAEQTYGGVRLMIECAEGVCETAEASLSRDEWMALVIQGSAALAGGK